ncbi:hypothetical protein [Mucisphaera sp.]|uniref:hypothetical protein n=1 Tax=Mucisphaera sp. TaxID=2913024 RepID=UPI003D0B7B3E
MIHGISYWSLEHGLANTRPVDAAIAEAERAGFDALELRVSPESVICPDLNDDECLTVREQIAATPLVIETLARGMSWAYNPTSISHSF